MDFLVGFATAVAFWPNIMAAATAPRWAVMSVGLPLLLMTVSGEVTRAHWYILASLLWAAITLLWAPVTGNAVAGLWQFALLSMAFAYGSWAGDERLAKLMLGAAVGLSINVALAEAQVFGGLGLVPQMAAPAGLFLNKNFLAEGCGVLLVAMLYQRQWWLATIMAIGVLICASRSVYLVLLVVACWYGARKSWIIGLGAAAALAACIFLVPHDDWAQRYFDLTYRWKIAASGLAALRPWGAGIGMFGDVTIDTYAHNDLLRYVVELGLGALPLVWAFLNALRGEPHAGKLVLVVLLLEGVFAFPLQLPFTTLLGGVLAGRLVGARAAVRDRRPVSAIRSRAYGGWAAP